MKAKKPTPKKPPTPINPSEKSLGKQFAQTLSACLLFKIYKGQREDSLHEQLGKRFAQTLFIGVGGFWGGLPSLE